MMSWGKKAKLYKILKKDVLSLELEIATIGSNDA